ncbi:MAG: hypothetical protein JWQ21_4105 [Herminiimonas sp.]|nr:hypothetical protein [Herminiimonas sp.]
MKLIGRITHQSAKLITDIQPLSIDSQKNRPISCLSVVNNLPPSLWRNCFKPAVAVMTAFWFARETRFGKSFDSINAKLVFALNAVQAVLYYFELKKFGLLINRIGLPLTAMRNRESDLQLVAADHCRCWSARSRRNSEPAQGFVYAHVNIETPHIDGVGGLSGKFDVIHVFPIIRSRQMPAFIKAVRPM